MHAVRLAGWFVALLAPMAQGADWPQWGGSDARNMIGQVHCIDAETGKRIWMQETKSQIWGSTFVADGKVYVGNLSENDGTSGGDAATPILSPTCANAPAFDRGANLERDGTPQVVGNQGLAIVIASATAYYF